MRDVAAIIVDIAVIDPKSKVLLDIAVALNGDSLPGPNWSMHLAAMRTLACPTQQTGKRLQASYWRNGVRLLDANTIGLPRSGDFRYSGVRTLFLS